MFQLSWLSQYYRFTQPDLFSLMNRKCLFLIKWQQNWLADNVSTVVIPIPVLTAALARFQTEVDGFCCTLRGESGSLTRPPSLPPSLRRWKAPAMIWNVVTWCWRTGKFWTTGPNILSICFNFLGEHLILSQKWMSESIRATILEGKPNISVWFVLQKKERLLSGC